MPHHLYRRGRRGRRLVGRPLAAGGDRGAGGDRRARQTPAIVVGGTGLYFRALTEGLADIPMVSESARAIAEAVYEAEGEEALRSRLLELDPPAAGAHRAERPPAAGPGPGRGRSHRPGAQRLAGRQTRPALERWTAVWCWSRRAHALYARCDAPLRSDGRGGARWTRSARCWPAASTRPCR